MDASEDKMCTVTYLRSQTHENSTKFAANVVAGLMKLMKHLFIPGMELKEKLKKRESKGI